MDRVRCATLKSKTKTSPEPRYLKTCQPTKCFIMMQWLAWSRNSKRLSKPRNQNNLPDSRWLMRSQDKWPRGALSQISSLSKRTLLIKATVIEASLQLLWTKTNIRMLKRSTALSNVTTTKRTRKRLKRKEKRRHSKTRQTSWLKKMRHPRSALAQGGWTMERQEFNLLLNSYIAPQKSFQRVEINLSRNMSVWKKKKKMLSSHTSQSWLIISKTSIKPW